MQKSSTICESHQKPIRFLCVSTKCNCKLSYCCLEEECQKKHDHPIRELIEINRLNDLITTSYYSLDHLIPKIRQYFKKAKETILQSIQKDEDILVYLIKRMEYCESEPIWQTLKDVMNGEYYKVTAKRTQTLLEDLQKQDRRNTVKLTARYYEEEVAKLKPRLDALLKSEAYGDLVLIKRFANPRKHIQLESNIVQDSQAIKLSNLLRKGGLGLVSLGLLYRGSDNDFDAYTYHSKVNGIAPTITLVKTTGQKIFGCYLHCKIVNSNDWIADPSRKSFIFSLDNNSIHRLKDDDEKLKAVFGGTKGPQIGFGCDFFIGDKCNKTLSSGSRLGGSYQLPASMTFRSPEADCYLAGSKEFLIEQYEVYKVL